MVGLGVALVPLVHGHPPRELLDGDVQPETQEVLEVHRVLFRLVVILPDLVEGEDLSQGRVHSLPEVLVIRIVLFRVRQVEDRQEPGILYDAFSDLNRFRAQTPPDGVFVVYAGRGDDQDDLLPAGIIRPRRQDVPEFIVGVRMDFVDDDA